MQLVLMVDLVEVVQIWRVIIMEQEVEDIGEDMRVMEQPRMKVVITITTLQLVMVKATLLLLPRRLLTQSTYQ